MIQLEPGTKVYLACRPVSMRYGFDGLAAQVTAEDGCLHPSGWCEEGHAFTGGKP